MKSGYFFSLIAVLAFLVLFVGGIPVNAETVELHPNGVAASLQNNAVRYANAVPAGPVRDDEGPHDISYDDDDGAWLIIRENYWSRVIFSPDEEFELRAVRLCLQDPNAIGNNPACQLRIYAEDQRTHNLGDLLWQTQVPRIPADPNEWMLFELDEEDFETFDARETFSIVYGPAPGGHPQQGGRGWWNSLDGTETNNIHSYYVSGNQPANAFGSWEAINIDLHCRANGEYARDVVNLSLTQASIRDEDDEPRWTTVVGQERFFHARIQNRGAETNGYILEYVVSDADGQDVWDDTIVNQERLAANAVVDETFEAWAPDTPGLYTVEISVTPFADDVDPNDNARIFEFIVADPVNDPDMWLGYLNPAHAWGRHLYGSDSTACATLFYHPGGDEAYTLTDFRVNLFIPANTQQEEISFALLRADFEHPLTITYTTVVEVDETGPSVWFEFEVPEEDQVSFNDSEAMVVTWFFREIGDDINRWIMINMDETPPISSQNAAMPVTAWITEDIMTEGFRGWTTSEWAMEAKLLGSEPEGRRLTIEPESLEFGYGLQHAQDHTVSANFISYGTDTVHVTSLDPARTLGRYLTFAAAPWAIAPQETLTVDFTFNADTLIDIFESSILITSDAENLDQRYIWGAQASTMNRVIRADLDNINFGFDCELDVNRNVDVTFSNPAPEALTVTGIEIPEEPAELRESFFFSVEQFEIPGEGEQIVTFTFRPQQVMSVNTRFTVLNTSENDLDLSIRIIASTLEVAENVRPGVPEEWSLGQNYPNPFNPLTTVDFALPAAGEVDFAVFDMSGRRVLDVFNGNLPAGYHSLNLDAGNLTPGVYIYRLSAPDYTSARKMVLLK